MSLGAMAAAAVMSFAGAAHASFYDSSFDPTFFLGVGHFFVPDSPSPCLALGSGFHSVNGGSDPCSGVVLLSASVTVDDGGGTAQLSLPPPTPAGNAITGMVLGSTAPLLIGINLSQIAIAATSCTGDLCGFNWFLAMQSGLTSPSDPLSSLFNQVVLFRQSCNIEFCGEITQFGDPAIHVTFTDARAPVPEPGMLSLILAGLGAGWLARRKKTAV